MRVVGNAIIIHTLIYYSQLIKQMTQFPFSRSDYLPAGLMSLTDFHMRVACMYLRLKTKKPTVNR